MCVEFADKILIFVLLKRQLLQQRETKASFVFIMYLKHDKDTSSTNYLPWQRADRIRTIRVGAFSSLHGNRSIVQVSSSRCDDTRRDLRIGHCASSRGS